MWRRNEEDTGCRYCDSGDEVKPRRITAKSLSQAFYRAKKRFAVTLADFKKGNDEKANEQAFIMRYLLRTSCKDIAEQFGVHPNKARAMALKYVRTNPWEAYALLAVHLHLGR